MTWSRVPRRRRRRLTRRGRRVVALLVIVVIGAGAFFVWNALRGGDDADAPPQAESPDFEAVDASQPDDVAEVYLAGWAAQDWEELGELAVAAPEDFVDRHEAWWEGMQLTDATFTPSPAVVEGAVAAVPFRAELTVGDFGAWAYDSTLRLQETTEGWKVAWAAETLHPSLLEGQLMQLSRTWPERAALLAEDGSPLTTSQPVVTVGIVPERITDLAALQATLQSELGITPERVQAEPDRPGVQPDWFLPLAEVRGAEYAALRPVLFPVPGVAFRETTRRTGPIPGFALHVLGQVAPATEEAAEALGEPYQQGDSVGAFGLESVYEQELAGSPSGIVERLSATGEPLEVLHTFPGRAPEPAATTLSIPAQLAAERALEGVELPAAVVAVDTRTGEIKAAASRPLDGFNRAFEGRYPPGSTFKIVTAATALEAGLSPTATVGCPAETTIDGRVFSNFGGTGLGGVTLLEAFAASCNTTFADLAAGFDDGELDASAGRFGFDADVDLGLAAYGGSFPAPDDDVERAAAAIGQGRVLASPLHMATVAAAGGSGSWMPPSLAPTPPPTGQTVLTSPNAAGLDEMMRAVVTDGTGVAADVPEGAPVHGKTGTAEAGTEGNEVTHAWFVGYQGNLAVAVVVEGGESGGSVAAPIAGTFFAAFAEEAESYEQRAGCSTAGEAGWTVFQAGGSRSGCTQRRAITDPVVAWSANAGVQAWLNNPVISGDNVFVGSAGRLRGTTDAEDGVYAYAVADGTPAWTFSAANDVNGVAIGGNVLVATGDQGAVWGLFLEDGSAAWTWRYPGDEPVAQLSNPLVIEDRAVIGDAAGTLRAFSLSTGAVAWEAEFDGAIRGGAASDGERIYAVGESGDARALTVDGEQLWRTTLTFTNNAGEQLFARVVAAPTVVDDLVVVTYVRDDAYDTPAIVALDRFTGAERWRASDPQTLVDGWGNLRSSVAAVGRQLLVAPPVSNQLVGLDAVTGEVQWAVAAGPVCTPHWPSAAVIDDLVVLPRFDGSVYGIDLVELTTVWEIEVTDPDRSGLADCEVEGSARSPFQASPAVADDGTVLVGALDGMLYAIRDAGW